MPLHRTFLPSGHDNRQCIAIGSPTIIRATNAGVNFTISAMRCGNDDDTDQLMEDMAGECLPFIHDGIVDKYINLSMKQVCMRYIEQQILAQWGKRIIIFLYSTSVQYIYYTILLVFSTVLEI
jgi:hypothetical protein